MLPNEVCPIFTVACRETRVRACFLRSTRTPRPGHRPRCEDRASTAAHPDTAARCSFHLPAFSLLPCNPKALLYAFGTVPAVWKWRLQSDAFQVKPLVSARIVVAANHLAERLLLAETIDVVVAFVFLFALLFDFGLFRRANGRALPQRRGLDRRQSRSTEWETDDDLLSLTTG